MGITPQYFILSLKHRGDTYMLPGEAYYKVRMRCYRAVVNENVWEDNCMSACCLQGQQFLLPQRSLMVSFPIYLKVFEFTTTYSSYQPLAMGLTVPFHLYDIGQFHVKKQKQNKQKKTKFYTFTLYAPCIFPLPSPPTSLLLPFLKEKSYYTCHIPDMAQSLYKA